MIKDPFFKEETPYDFLGIDPEAPHNEIHNALPRFLRNKKNISKIGKAQDAVKKLRNSFDRMAIDIFYYNIVPLVNDDIVHKEINEFLAEYLKVPTVPYDEFYTDIDKEDFSNEFREIPFRKIRISHISKFNNIRSLKLEIEFDK